MQNLYSRSKNNMNKAGSFTEDADDDVGDYENVSDISRGPAVPARERKIHNADMKEDLKLKCLAKPELSSDVRKHSNVNQGARPVPAFQPPPIGLDFSSSAVNAAFTDPPDAQSSEKSHKLGWMKRVLVFCLILLLLVSVMVITYLVFTYLSKVQQSVSNNRKLWDEDLRKINLTFGKEIKSLKTDIQIIKKHLGLCTSCPPEWMHRGSKCYFFSKSHQNWDMSQRDCINHNATLLILTSKSELDALLPVTGNKRFWIGLRKFDKVWKWVNEMPPGFTNWNPNEPNNYGSQEHCTEMITGGWNDLDCSNTIDYICQKPPLCL
ncbi:CD209 antigen-like protein D [Hyperolius riggenbachi]|uniref:CD209 antigen-like protein D n=1 Tax=Hyperolius riggenbachi TaxID=752182 RepID=UPI0035A28FBE